MSVDNDIALQLQQLIEALQKQIGGCLGLLL